MKANYLYVLTLDGPICGIRETSLVSFNTDTPHDLTQFHTYEADAGYDHLSSYLDIDEWEEENGCEIEADTQLRLATADDVEYMSASDTERFGGVEYLDNGLIITDNEVC